MPVTITREKAFETAETIGDVEVDENGEGGECLAINLIQVLYIWYLITFWKKFVLILFNSGSKLNAIFPTFAQELKLCIRLIDVGVQKIDGIMLNTYRMIFEAFLVTNKANLVRFFE